MCLGLLYALVMPAQAAGASAKSDPCTQMRGAIRRSVG